MPDRRRRAAPLLPLPATSPGTARLPGEGVLSSALASSVPFSLRLPVPNGTAVRPGSGGLALRSGEPGDSGSGTGSGAGSGTGSGPGAGPGSGSDSGSGTGSGSDSGTGPGTGPGSDSDSGQQERNPFAPPPEGVPDQEWRPRRRAQDGSQGSHPEGGQGEDGPPAWGSRWSSRQPGRQSGGFGNRPGRPTGQSGPEGRSGGLRWDPTDPAQRRARYALLAGLWAFFFALFSLPEVALLLGALALYWGISSLRAKPRAGRPSAAATTAAMEGRPTPSASGTGQATPGSTRPQTTAAVSGLVTASLALLMVAATFFVKLAYHDYFTCVDDALTRTSAKSCEKLLPKEFRPLLGSQEE
ncbi:hypothetical protein [Streptomyces sp. NBC_01525]|uniref:hypothetical protein n=1 Tax=Streptomyces sp. NBC_01525 TaxID=2903893 RepID=UPI0038682337